MSLYNKLKKHIDHVGLYIEQDKKGDVLVRCFARLHGGNSIILLRVKPEETMTDNRRNNNKRDEETNLQKTLRLFKASVGKLITNADLASAIYPDQPHAFVTPSQARVLVKQARDEFEAKGQGTIKAVRGRGYVYDAK